MPWLWLAKPVSVSEFNFVPFLDDSGAVAAPLASLKDAFPIVLSSYYDAQERPRLNCVVVTNQRAQSLDEPWDLTAARLDDVRWASSLLFLASWAANEYFTPVGSYVNDASFQLYFQRFTEPVDFVSLSYRKRDGRVLYGGPKHGVIHFMMPLCCSSSQFHLEGDFLASLNAADTTNSLTVERLKAVLPLVRLANTDNDGMTLNAEAALMGFAFEQYFRVTRNNKADQLAERFDRLFATYGTTTAQAAQAQRPGMSCKTQQRSWPVSKFWMWELYQYRSAIVHGGFSPNRAWGWDVQEHLVMAAFVFPLLVKLDLAKEHRYSLPREDEIRCRAVDALLSQTDWAKEKGSNMQTQWQSIIREHKRDVRISAAVKNAIAELKTKGIDIPSETDI